MATKKKKNGAAKLPAKYRKMGLKKGWPAYKKAKAAAAAKRKKSVKKKTTKKKATKKKTTKKKTTKKKTTKKKRTKKVSAKKSKKASPKKKNNPGKSKKKGKGTSMAKTEVRLLSPKVVNAMTSGGAATTGLILGTGAVNYLPVIKDQKAWIKGLAQALLGVGGFAVSNNKYWKMGFVGTTLGALYTFVAPYLPQQLKLAGRDFSQAELQELMTLGIIDESTDISNMLGVVDEDTDLPMMGKGRYHTAIDVY